VFSGSFGVSNWFAPGTSPIGSTVLSTPNRGINTRWTGPSNGAGVGVTVTVESGLGTADPDGSARGDSATATKSGGSTTYGDPRLITASATMPTPRTRDALAA
jgi:hypothetical protein